MWDVITLSNINDITQWLHIHSNKLKIGTISAITIRGFHLFKIIFNLHSGKKKIFFRQLQVQGEEVFVKGLFRKNGLNGNELDKDEALGVEDVDERKAVVL